MEDNKTHQGIEGISDEDLEYFGKNSEKMNEIERKMRGEGNGINTACLTIAVIALVFFLVSFALIPLISFLSDTQSVGYIIGDITVLRFDGSRLKVVGLVQFIRVISIGFSFIGGIVSVILGTKGLGRNLGRGKGYAGLWIGWIVTIASVLIIIVKILLLYSAPIDF